jgi:uncharacterized membrane protein YidH (DUF202 family)
MRMTHHGLRGVTGLLAILAVLAVLAAGVASARFAPALHATASHTVSHTQLAAECPTGTGHC